MATMSHEGLGIDACHGMVPIKDGCWLCYKFTSRLLLWWLNGRPPWKHELERGQDSMAKTNKLECQQTYMVM